MKKVKLMLPMILFCSALSFISEVKEQPVSGDMLIGIGYAMAEGGESNEFIAGTSVVGLIATTALQGSLAGPAGTAFGIVAGL